MEIIQYIRLELKSLERELTTVTTGLTQQEIMWRPACGCNPIGLILFHMARSEDTFFQSWIQNKPQVWEAEKWHQRLNLPENEAGNHYTVDQVNAFTVPDLKELLAYQSAVRGRTTDYVKASTPAIFDNRMKTPLGDLRVADICILLVTHASQHMGEISYLRGLQRGLDK